ncbi:MAG: hypothetical protein AAGM46_28090, partial [Cyanobacteria bacterium J06582_2]
MLPFIAPSTDPLSQGGQQSQPSTTLGDPLKASNDEGNRSNHNRRKTKAKSNINRTPDMKSLFGPQSESWTKFFNVTFDENQAPNNIRIWTEIRKLLGNDDFSCVKRPDGTVLIDAKTEANAKKIRELQAICNVNITTSRDQIMNSKRGTVLIPSSEYDNPAELPQIMQEQIAAQELPISEISIFPVTSKRSGNTIRIAKLTFETRSLPPTMKIGFQEVSVREETPKPRQCENCWRFGHKTEYCRSNSCCPICSSAHLISECRLKDVDPFEGCDFFPSILDTGCFYRTFGYIW